MWSDSLFKPRVLVCQAAKWLSVWGSCEKTKTHWMTLLILRWPKGFQMRLRSPPQNWAWNTNLSFRSPIENSHWWPWYKPKLIYTVWWWLNDDINSFNFFFFKTLMCKSETQITDLNNDNNRNIKAEGTAILQDHRRTTYCVTTNINKAITLINSQILLIFF